MVKFWAIAILIFISTMYIIARLTLKKQRKEAGDRMWRLWYGRSAYWQLVGLSSLGITTLIMFILYWIGFPVL